MLVWLAEHLVKYYSGFNVFSYLTFRAIVSLLTALFISLWMGPRMIAHLQKLSFGQVVRNDGPESHFSKRGTPTMGGIMILTAIVISVLLWAYPSNPYVWCVLVVLVGYGVIGFVDDYRKVVRKDTKGLIARWKYFWMSVIALGSLALGGALGIIAVLLRQEFLLVIMGGVFVVETLSVILQVGSFKLRGQRIFRMAPIHHHYELKGWPEPRVIVRFWIISLMLVLIGLATLKVR